MWNIWQVVVIYYTFKIISINFIFWLPVISDECNSECDSDTSDSSESAQSDDITSSELSGAFLWSFWCNIIFTCREPVGTVFCQSVDATSKWKMPRVKLWIKTWRVLWSYCRLCTNQRILPKWSSVFLVFLGVSQTTRIIPRFLIAICCFHQQLCYQETVMQKLKCCLISCIWPSFLSQLSIVINISLFALQSMSAT